MESRYTRHVKVQRSTRNALRRIKWLRQASLALGVGLGVGLGAGAGLCGVGLGVGFGLFGSGLGLARLEREFYANFERHEEGKW